MNRTIVFLVLAGLLLGDALLSTSHAPPPTPPRPVATPIALARPRAVSMVPGGSSAAPGTVVVSAAADRTLLHPSGGVVTVQIDVTDLPTPNSDELDTHGWHEFSYYDRVSMVLVLDRSRSMDGQKLTQAKEAARTLVDRLEPADRLGLVHFGSDVVSLPLRTMDEVGKAQLRAAIDELSADGANNLSLALQTGSELLEGVVGVRAMVLASDGQPKLGQTADVALTRLLRTIHGSGVTVTALGIGADHDGVLMTHLAEAGGGFYGSVRDGGQLEELLGREIAQARAVNARNVRLRFSLGPGVSVLEVAGRQLIDGELSLPDFKAGDEARVFVRLRVPRAGQGPGVDALRTLVSWTRTEDSQGQFAQAGVRLGTSDDLAEVWGSRDEVVCANVAQAFERGDRAF